MSKVDANGDITKTRNVYLDIAFSNTIKSAPTLHSSSKLDFDSLSEANMLVNFDEWFHYLGYDIMREVTFSKKFGFLDQTHL